MPDNKPRRWPLIAAALATAALLTVTGYGIHTMRTAALDYGHHLKDAGAEFVIEHILLEAVLHKLALAAEIILKLIELLHWATS